MRLLKLHPLSEICNETTETVEGTSIRFGYFIMLCVSCICEYKPQLVTTNIQCVSRDTEDVYFIEIVAVALFLELHLLRLN